MKRSFWFVAGAGAGVYGMVRARRVAEAFTADGLRDRAAAVKVGLRALRDDVAAGQAEKETELRERFGLERDGPAELTGGLDTGSLRSPGSTTENGALRSVGSTNRFGSTAEIGSIADGPRHDKDGTT